MAYSKVKMKQYETSKHKSKVTEHKVNISLSCYFATTCKCTTMLDTVSINEIKCVKPFYVKLNGELRAANHGRKEKSCPNKQHTPFTL